MTGTLRNQLAQHGMGDRLDEVLTETAAVRRDLGYPIMATPFSQLVGTQAVLNVVGRRALRGGARRGGGLRGGALRHAARAGRRRRPRPDHGLAPRRRDRRQAARGADASRSCAPEYGTGTDDDELILRALLPAEAVDAMRAAGPVRRDYPLSGPELDQVRALLAGHRLALPAAWSPSRWIWSCQIVRGLPSGKSSRSV